MPHFGPRFGLNSPPKTADGDVEERGATKSRIPPQYFFAEIPKTEFFPFVSRFVFVEVANPPVGLKSADFCKGCP